MLKKGLFGIDLKHQVAFISLTYSALSLVGITFGFFLYLHPDSFVHEAKDNHEQLADERRTQEYAWTTSRVDIQQENLTDSSVTSTTDLIEDITTSNEYNPNLHYQNIVKYIRNEGIEAIIGCFLKLFCSVLLYLGVRNNKHILFLPWLIEESIEMVGGVILFVIQTTQAEQWSVSSFMFGLLFYFLGCYFLYSVGSFFVLLKRKNVNSDIIVQSVSQGISGGGFQHGLNYQRLEEECWQSEPNLARESRPEHGFGREKKVVDDDEHVLYVQ